MKTWPQRVRKVRGCRRRLTSSLKPAQTTDKRHLKLNRYDTGKRWMPTVGSLTSAGSQVKCQSWRSLKPIFREIRIFDDQNGSRIQSFAALPNATSPQSEISNLRSSDRTSCACRRRTRGNADNARKHARLRLAVKRAPDERIESVSNSSESTLYEHRHSPNS